jgi:hypothetical protein
MLFKAQFPHPVAAQVLRMPSTVHYLTGEDWQVACQLLF